MVLLWQAWGRPIGWLRGGGSISRMGRPLHPSTSTASSSNAPSSSNGEISYMGYFYMALLAIQVSNLFPPFSLSRHDDTTYVVVVPPTDD